ncbi:NADP-dependent oxidoreductase [Mucilaginibacter paludis]|uniref:Alcohol dehydrogenase zinc-binding domain protein n=1 Tax=Mucilaginibacter paludis DSM 18603 TaxID=714943 RepID=H1Y631_9SPHI|nr:NADP-dependent oxidoreductase [Mucilaginibacter paludis]EHQ30990.1 Alcohol dehydrogenase zinc-binding domain protein [Mucilaginibacter paludis DSM 18603]
MNKVIVLYKRPVGKAELGDFKTNIEEMPTADDGEVLLKTIYVSVDPYLRGRMNDAESYIPPFELNKPLQSGIIAEVVDSNNTLFKIGDFVLGNLEWKEYQVSDGKGLRIIPNDPAYLTAYLGVLGMTGLTAYLGLTQIGLPKPGETLVVSGAAGAVGSIVGQVGKLLGCRVVGITGSDEKVQLLKSKFHFDEAINYKNTVDLTRAITAACPNGVDIYFDNVGGKISDDVLNNINKHARIPLCGAISLYNDATPVLGPYIQPVLVKKSALIQGFIVGDFAAQFPEATKQLREWLMAGKLTYHETIYEGFDHITQAFLGLFEGSNEGKMVVKI